MPYKYWNSQELSFLCENYQNFGALKCSKILGRSRQSVQAKAVRLNLFISKECKSRVQSKISKMRKSKTKEQYKVNIDNFITNFTSESSYVLGFLWADGYLSGKRLIRVECVKKDIDELYSVFLKTGEWKRYYRNRLNRQPQGIIHTSNKLLSKYLTTHNYNSKNYGYPTILNTIPSELIHMWFRGVVDGDGCWYLNQKNHLRQFSLTGAYTQDWSFAQKMFDELNINCKIVRRIQGKNKYSVVRVTGFSNLKSLGKFIYGDYEENKIGLPRKYNKWKEVMNSYGCDDGRRVDKFLLLKSS